jgi:hypothetical protein
MRYQPGSYAEQPRFLSEDMRRHTGAQLLVRRCVGSMCIPDKLSTNCEEKEELRSMEASANALLEATIPESACIFCTNTTDQV